MARWLPFAALVAVLVPTTAHAELVMVDSLELQVVRADVVVAGRVIGVTPTDEPRWQEILLASDAVLKDVSGQRKKAYRFTLRISEEAAKALEKAGDILVFLVGGHRYKGVPDGHTRQYTALRSRTFYDGPLRLAALPAQGIPSRAFTMLTTRGQVLEVAREAAKSKASSAHEAIIDTPFESQVHRAYYAGSAVELGVPVDAMTERYAVGKLASPAAWERAEAVRILRHFKSDAHVARLKGLLSDKGEATRTDSSGARTIVYIVRRAAWEVLDAWGVSVPRPVIERPAPR